MLVHITIKFLANSGDIGLLEGDKNDKKFRKYIFNLCWVNRIKC